MTSYGNSIGGRGLRRCACNGQIKSARARSVFEWGNEHTEVQVQCNLPPGVPDWNSFSAVAWGGEVHVWLCVCFVYDRRITSGWKPAWWGHWSGLWDSFNTYTITFTMTNLCKAKHFVWFLFLLWFTGRSSNSEVVFYYYYLYITTVLIFLIIDYFYVFSFYLHFSFCMCYFNFVLFLITCYWVCYIFSKWRIHFSYCV